MAAIALRIGGAVAGAAIGDFLGGPLGALQGAAAGYELGSTIANNIPHHTSNTSNAGIDVQLSTYGEFITKAYGNIRVAGNVIWMQPIFQTSQTTSEGKGGGQKQSSTTYSYTVTLAIAICEGPIDNIGQVWADSELLSLADLANTNGTSYNIYLGSETQMPDPIIESFDGVGNVPPYRGLAYVVIENFPLDNYGDRIPNFTFQVNRVIRATPNLEGMISNIGLKPGYGECAYEDVIQRNVTTVTTDSSEVINLASTYTPNMNTVYNSSDVIANLAQGIFATLGNMKWVTVYVAWFADSLDAGSCTIVPKVEYQGNAETTPNAWSVAGLTRSTATLINQQDGIPNYGGTPSDQSILDCCIRMINNNLNVMLVPIILVDTNSPYAKPARWRITPGNATDAANFFTKTNGYNDFINHYANLSIGGINLKDYVNIFSIGSGLGGLTSFQSSGTYTCVNELVSLAGTVKSELAGSRVTVHTLYAADWNEYHSDSTGTYNLDPLWASNNIDFVGINAYFPLTPDLPQSDITYQDVYNGWTSGEGWDYVWNSERTVQTPITAGQAWKNFGYWWNNYHTNPGGGNTSWTPQMKQLWFTEIGFPSVDACSNQPSVVYDATSYESAYPRASKGRVDNFAQRQALQASLSYLQTLNFMPGNAALVPQIFVYGWDIRPYPAYPNLDALWPDADTWATGYDIQGKLGTSSIGDVVAEIMTDALISSAEYDTSLLTGDMNGYVIDQIETARDGISQLGQAYFFDMVESSGVMKFIPRGQQPVATVIDQQLSIPSGASASKNNTIRQTVKITRTQQLDLPNVYNITYMSPDQQFQDNTQIAMRQVGNAANIINLSFDLTLNDQDAKNMATIMLYADWVARNAYDFSLPPSFAYLEPTDVINLVINGENFIARITETTMQLNGSQAVKAVSEDPDVYDFYLAPGGGNQQPQLPGLIPQTAMDIFSLPALPHDGVTDAYLTFCATSLDPVWNGAFLYRSDDGGNSGGNTWTPVQPIIDAATMGVAKTTLAIGSVWVIDNINTVQVALYHGTLSSTTVINLLNGANVAMLGAEMIQYLTATMIDTGVYELSGLLRGRQGTTDQVSTHVSGENFVTIDGNINRITQPLSNFNIQKFYEMVSVGDTLAQSPQQSNTWDARCLKPYPPLNTKGVRDSSGNLTITWFRRTRISGEWLDYADVPLNEETEAYSMDILDGPTVVRTINATSPTLYYSAADQVTDFGSTQSTVYFSLYQISAAVGRGIGRTDFV